MKLRGSFEVSSQSHTGSKPLPPLLAAEPAQPLRQLLIATIPSTGAAGLTLQPAAAQPKQPCKAKAPSKLLRTWVRPLCPRPKKRTAKTPAARANSCAAQLPYQHTRAQHPNTHMPCRTSDPASPFSWHGQQDVTGAGRHLRQGCCCRSQPEQRALAVCYTATSETWTQTTWCRQRG